MPVGVNLIECMARYIGQTVTIFTQSGGLSGNGFTGVLICVDDQVVKLLCDIGAAPACPLGSACTGPLGDGYGYGSGYGAGIGGGCCCNGGGSGYGDGFAGVNPLGSVINIPICAIAAFTHNAI